ALRRAHGDVVEIEHAEAILGPQPHRDVDLLAAHPEHAGPPAADARLDRRGDVLHADAELGDAPPVEHDALLRAPLAVARVHVLDARYRLDAIGDLPRDCFRA